MTARVKSARKTAATGPVEILNGSAVLTTQTLGGDGCAYWYIAPGLAAGPYVFTAAYSGDKNNPAGVSAPTTIVANPIPTTISISSGTGSTPYGVNLRRTVTVSSNAGPPQGVITYSLDGGAAVPVSLSNGSAVLTIPGPASGTHQLVIGYAQQTNYAAAASQTVSFTVTPATTTMILSVSAPRVQTGTAVTFAAAVNSTTAGAPNATGSVSFFDGTAQLAAVPVDASGKASYTTANLSVGRHGIVATYAGSDNYAASTTATKVDIYK
ncbi:MAG: Ig-like domain repeat protein [Terracidiphilus sp.]